MVPPSSSVIQQLRRLKRSSFDFHRKLSEVLCGDEYVRCVPNLQEDDLVWLVNYLDKALDLLDPCGPAFPKCLRELNRICSTSAILPASYTLPSNLLSIGSESFAEGGYSDVYEGTFNNSRVCIKRMRVYTQDVPQRVSETFYQEAVMWKYLTHQNVVPLLGITLAPPQLVSVWMPGGDLLGYIERNSGADRLGLLSDVAKGLHHLHSCGVIHGGIKGPNVLVDDSDHARIADFGHATIAEDEDSTGSDSGELGHSLRWTAPEIWTRQMTNSKETDIFSFAMVMVEVFTGVIPFSDGSSVMAMLAITQGRRPPRPEHPAVTGAVWKLMQRCWDGDPRLRPKASEALQVLLTSNPPAWKRLISHTLSTNERIDLIKSIFSDPDEAEVFQYISGNDAQDFVDMIDEVLDGSDNLPSEIRRRCLRSSYRICGREALLPKSLLIPLCYNPANTPHSHGGFADVWKGKHNGQEVAAKGLRVSLMSDFDQIRKRFCREVVTWKALRHPNVLPLMGVTMTEIRFVMISEWMENGNINAFVKAHPNADRLELLSDAIRGLIYMHDLGTVHGDLKGANILVDNNRRARISDFSLLTIISGPETLLSARIEGGTTPWMSPELLDPERFGLEDSHLTKESDCYALGMVIYEVLSGRAPFASAPGLLVKILRGDRPERPRGPQGARFTDSIWEMLESCWQPRPRDRPNIDALLQCLQSAAQPSGLSSHSDEGVESDVDEPGAATSNSSANFMSREDTALPRSRFRTHS